MKKGYLLSKFFLIWLLGNDEATAKQAAEVLKTQVFLYDADTARLKEAYETGNVIAKDILESYAKSRVFFTKLQSSRRN